MLNTIGELWCEVFLNLLYFYSLTAVIGMSRTTTICFVFAVFFLLKILPDFFKAYFSPFNSNFFLEFRVLVFNSTLDIKHTFQCYL